ncbi:MAG: hypothetical protein RIC55_06805 [Pirellulaceae bacterium]
MRRMFVLAAALTTVLAGFAAPVRADIFNAWGRHLGLGWSNGYHAEDACCPGPIWALRPGSRLKCSHPGYGVPSPIFQPAPAYIPAAHHGVPPYGPAPAAPWSYETLPYGAPNR